MPHPGESKTSPRRIQAAERGRQALELRLSGANFDQVAKALNYAGRSSAYRATKAALSRLPAIEVAEYRRVNLERLNKARFGIWKGVIAGDIKAIATEVTIQERESRYLGLDAPQRHEIDQTIHDREAEAKLLENYTIEQLEAFLVMAREWRQAKEAASAPK